MKLHRFLTIIAICGLILIMVITILYAAQKVSFGNFTMLLLTGTIIWFARAILATLYKKLFTLLLLTAIFTAVYGQWGNDGNTYNAIPNPPTDGLVGANYTPAYAVNQVQFWHDFRPEIVEKEMEGASRYFGISTLRVFLHNINFDEEKDLFQANIENFLEICHKYQIKPGFVFFDDCHRREGIYLDKPTTPVKGWHNGRWAACPQDRERDSLNLDKFKSYVQEIIKAHRSDDRVLFWEIINEPDQGGKFKDYSLDLRKEAYAWVKELKPQQPVISSWDDHEETDIVDAHNYRSNISTWDFQADMNAEKGTVFTEAGARWYAPRPSNREPCEVIDWLEGRRATGKTTPGVFLNWELMVGNSNCRWYWGTPEQAPEPTFPWCGLLWPDATPVSLAESEAILRYAKGKGRALLFEDFQETYAPQKDGWDVIGKREGSGVLSVSPGYKILAGNPAWSDYTVESVIMLKDSLGKAELLFRIHNPGQERNDYLGYFVEFDKNRLLLGKMVNLERKTLATYNLNKLDCIVTSNVWNHLRVEANGNRIKVWFNRMHPSSDPEKGVRIEYTDTEEPILSGNIGVMSASGDTWYDNIVVMPILEVK